MINEVTAVGDGLSLIHILGASVTENECLNREEAKKVIPVIRQLLGLETK